MVLVARIISRERFKMCIHTLCLLALSKIKFASFFGECEIFFFRKACKKQKEITKELREMFHQSAIFDIETTTVILMVSNYYISTLKIRRNQFLIMYIMATNKCLIIWNDFFSVLTFLGFDQLQIWQDGDKIVGYHEQNVFVAKWYVQILFKNAGMVSYTIVFFI